MPNYVHSEITGIFLLFELTFISENGLVRLISEKKFASGGIHFRQLFFVDYAKIVNCLKVSLIMVYLVTTRNA